MPTCYDRIAKQIDHAGGWLRFDHYMALALYAPGVGYYERPNPTTPPEPSSANLRKQPPGGPIGSLARGGDFITAPELSPLFATALSAQLCQWFESVPARVLEFGAGTGQLAADVLRACARAGRVPEEYAILEVSASMRERQRTTIAQLDPDLAARVRWLDQLPQQIEGIVLANELLDALPVRLFVADAGRVLERGVVRLDRGSDSRSRSDGDACSDAPEVRLNDVPDGSGAAPEAAAGKAAFAWADRPAEPAFAQAVTQAIGEAGWSIESAQGYLSEWPEQALGWAASVAERIQRGALLLIDYGFPRSEFYHPARHTGTLMCHAQHRSHPDPLIDPGQRDITAHVDFSAIANAIIGTGMRCAGYTSQARFLINCGLLDHLSAPSGAAIREHSAQMAAVQMLLSEAEMGELFKAMAFTRHLPDTVPLGFQRGDRSMSLSPRS